MIAQAVYGDRVIDFGERLDAIERRLSAHAMFGPEPGLTDPDPGADERWEAMQVWAHMAEFVGYWHGQARRIVAEYAGDPVAFGRLKTDENRIASIEAGRRRPISELAEQVQASIADVRGWLAELRPEERTAVGRHRTAGELDIDGLVERFIVDHLEEHLDQLDGLAARAGTG